MSVMKYRDLPPQFQYYSDSDMSNSVEHPTPPPTLTRLEVESASITSLPISLPYLYITEQTNSFDTYNLLNRNSTNDLGPKYPNTLHINANSNPNSPAKQSSAPADQHPSTHMDTTTPGRPTQPSDDSFFNQVPKRFSQFILDQQNPYISQRLDNLSVVSHSLGSDEMVVKNTTKRTFSTNSKKTKLSSNSKPSTAQHTPYSNTLSREISNSMGSQATIFSTRPDHESTTPQRRSRRERLGPNRFARSRSSKVKSTALYTVDSGQSLERKNAIRFKQGSLLYRLKARLKKFILKIKSLKFRNFKVSSKGLTKKPSKIKRNKSLKFAVVGGNSKGRRPVISAPSTNPNLGLVDVQRVADLDDNIKFEAGAPQENVNIVHRKPSMGKLDHLSSYIDEQQTSYDRRKSHETSIAYAPTNVLDPKRFNQNHIQPHEKDLLSNPDTAESEAPLPPPHIVNSLPAMSEQLRPSPEEAKHMTEMWRSYLSHVLCRRIQLRQEISMFQTFVASKAVNTFDLPEEDLSKASSPTTRIEPIESTIVQNASDSGASPARSDTISGSSCSASTFTTTTDSDGMSDIFVDPPAEEFSKTYLNRRSMLGEMLEYESDNSDTLSLHSTTSGSPSVTHSDLSIAKTYGTIKRKSERGGGSIASLSSVSTMRRSEAYQFNLNHLATQT